MNKFLVIQASVVLTPVIAPVIESLDRYFEKANLKAVVTSGLRDKTDQLRVIRQYLTKKGLAEKYPDAMTCALADVYTDGTFKWQMAWSNLLHVGVIINPPVTAKCLMDYMKNGRNLKGATIPPTAHARGTAFDIGGSGNGVADEAAVIQKAMDDKLPGLVSFLVERENNAIHCNCRTVIPKPV